MLETLLWCACVLIAAAFLLAVGFTTLIMAKLFIRIFKDKS